MTEKSIISKLWDDLESIKKPTDTDKRVLKWLGRDFLNDIQLDGDVFWFEQNLDADMPNYIYEYLKKWGKNKGYRYLFDVKIEL